MSDNVAVVGDVHGSSHSLALAAKWLLADWDGRVVFVGDYVNRGPDSRGVLEILVQLQTALGDRLTLLMGNHEVVLLEFLQGGQFNHFLAHGGLQTIHSYLSDTPEPDPFEEFRSAFPDSHLELLRALLPAYETPDLLITHCGFNPADPESRNLDDVVLGSFPSLFASGTNMPKQLVVCGHYVQRSRQPYCSERLICLDTGCGSVPGAPLTVLLLPSREFRTFGGQSD